MLNPIKAVAYKDIDTVFADKELETRFAKYWATKCQIALNEHHGIDVDLRSAIAVFIKAAIEDYPKFVEEHNK